jgi:hypothetical protein
LSSSTTRSSTSCFVLRPRCATSSSPSRRVEMPIVWNSGRCGASRVAEIVPREQLA